MEKGSHTSHLNPRRIYLFNDIILYTKLDQSKECVQGVLYLKALRVEESPQNDLFIIHDESGGSGKSWDFKPDKMMLTRWIKDLRKYIKLAKKNDTEFDCVSVSNNSHPIKIYGSIYHRDEYGRAGAKPRLLTKKDRKSGKMTRRRSTFFGLVSSPFHSSSHKSLIGKE